jgi:hypothetical protein
MRKLGLLQYPVGQMSKGLRFGIMLETVELRARERRNRLFVSLRGSLDWPLSLLDVGGTVEHWSKVQVPSACLRRTASLMSSAPSQTHPHTHVGRNECPHEPEQPGLS